MLKRWSDRAGFIQYLLLVEILNTALTLFGQFQDDVGVISLSGKLAGMEVSLIAQ